ncbi:glycosyltransferase family 2 protein [Methanosarcina sp.]|uniref:glycosyltransferase family 2 protein n=1 Tax=Methanosarcina sp. TaxID=2213 RepID=UPI002989565C|nr:glycosyltransferase family 2 protein [Methanosarcina sp.]MDW5549186.1 glycosyltransferase family 2 protein [Methanosarcina sp.]MDW5553108.1 glycosyltransferase family 2 protein [Methanosarcina sp.]MDW5559366.1 glycosyltransferase family 2 protein [Methanosarcina sp.]
MDLKVSVITVCYNAEKFIEQAINSVLKQRYENIEYIIIDGASTDNTVSIINKYKSKVSFFLSESDNGMYDAMNKGITAATGDILYFLNSDDVFYDEYVITKIVNLFHKNKDIELIYGSIFVIRDPLINDSFVRSYDHMTKSSFVSDGIYQQAIFYKAELFKKCGQFDETYKIVGDYEWLLRAFYKYNIKRKYYGDIITAVFRYGGMSNCDKFSSLHSEERRKVVKQYFNIYQIYNSKFKRAFIASIKKFIR